MTEAAVGYLRHSDETIRYVRDSSFKERSAPVRYGSGGDEVADEREFAVGHMPDELTRDLVKRMHYAAYRADRARKGEEVQQWRHRYFHLRDRVVLGNRKLVFGAVRRKLYRNQAADDLIGECYIVMIRAVAAYNPWIGVRFSTYAYTCLMRALSRLNQRSISDKLSQHLSLDFVGEEPLGSEAEVPPFSSDARIDEFLKDDHPLLSDREKTVIRRRFHLSSSRKDSTLEKVGRDLGISKERVRQVQTSAIGKLRQALLEAGVES